MKLLKPTAFARDLYARGRYADGTPTLHPLAYFLFLKDEAGNDHSCNVEGLYETDGPKYEALAPDGFHFLDGSAPMHSVLALNLDDIRERMDGMTLARCTREC